MTAIDNPYEGIDWAEIGSYRFQTHVHTNYASDVGHNGGELPHEIIEFYAGEGRVPIDIVALTDHQRSVDTTVFPWTEWTDLDRIPAESAYENRDPAEMGLVAIEGLEVEGNSAEIDQMGGFNAGDLVQEYDDVRDIFETIDEAGGWGWFFHPGEYYDEPDAGWADGYYREYLEEIPACIGMEVVNGGVRCPEDEDLWDNALADLAPDRRVVGAAGDDLHGIHDGYPMSWNTVLLPPETFDPAEQAATRDAIQAAVTAGRMLFSHANPDDPDARPPTVDSLRASSDGQDATIRASHVDTIEWISEGTVVETGERVSVTDAAVGSYLRARLTKEGEGRTWTQALLVGAE